MSRSLPAKPNLDNLKREAKRILRSIKAGDTSYVQWFQQSDTSAPADVGAGKKRPTLLEVQHALARDYGFSGWRELKSYIESTTPLLRSLTPTLAIDSAHDAIEHYVDWLGFDLDWEWREAPNQPAIMAMSRDEVRIMLNEYPQEFGPSIVHINVKNIDALVSEWNAKRPDSVELRIAPPYEFPDVSIRDPSGNVLVFEGQDVSAEQKRQDTVRPKMRDFVKAELAAGRAIPTPEEVRQAVGPPLGTAIEVLNEFPEYADAYNERTQGADDRGA